MVGKSALGDVASVLLLFVCLLMVLFSLLADGTVLTVCTASGSVHGKQTVPRSEMTGLLHALLHTKGDAVFQCDNKGVWRTFCKGPRAQPRHNGILWNLIFKAAKNRHDLGYGSIQLEWIKSHLKADVAIAQGQCPGKEFANAIADIYADNAAAHFQAPK